MNRRPPVPDAGREFQPVHGPGHVDVGEDQLDIAPGFEDGNRRIGVVCNDRYVKTVPALR